MREGAGVLASGHFVIAVPDFFPTLGGTTTQAANYASALRRKGHEVTILTRHVDATWPPDDTWGEVRVVRVGPPGRTGRSEKAAAAAVFRWLRRHRGQIDGVDVIMYPDYAVAAVLAGLGRRSVMVWAGLGDAGDTIGRGGPPLRRVLQAARRRLVGHAAHVVLTPAMSAELEHIGLAPPTILPIPVDVERFHPPSPEERSEARREVGAAEDELVVVYVGQLRRLKAVGHLIEAVATLCRQGHATRLVIVGAGRGAPDDEEDALRRQAAPLGASVVFTGAVPDVERRLWAGDVFVLPSTREGMPNSVLEALACGLPCVVPPSAGGEQVLTPATGIVPPSNAPEHLVEALLALTSDPVRRRHMGAAAATAAQSVPDATVELLLELHERHQRVVGSFDDRT